MKLYRWDSFARRFTTTVLKEYLPLRERVVIQSLQIDKGKCMNATVNSEDSFICLLSGAWRMNIANNYLIVQSDEAVMIPSGFVHSAEAIEDSFAVQVELGEDTTRDQELWGV